LTIPRLAVVLSGPVGAGKTEPAWRLSGPLHAKVVRTRTVLEQEYHVHERAPTPYWQLVAPFAISGIGMAMFWAPVANVVLSAVKPEEQGQASGANNAIRELGGVFGVAVLAGLEAEDP
jgi:MFS family permease